MTPARYSTGLPLPAEMLKTLQSGCRLAGLLLCITSTGAVHGHAGAHAQIEWLDRQIAETPDSQSLYIQRGVTWSDDGQYQHAATDLAYAETLGDATDVALAIGILRYRQGDLDTAIEYLDRYLNKYPRDTHALEYRARVKRDAGDLPGAVTDFEALFAARPNPNPGYYISAAKMLASGDDQGTDAALALLDQGMEQLGAAPQLQHYAISLETRREHYPAALARLRSMQHTLGSSPQWQVDMGAMLAKTGDTRASRRHYQAAQQQLQNLRQTPARVALQQQVTAALDAQE